MPFADLLNQEASSVFSDDDRIMHTTKMVERAFGRPLADIGRVEMHEGSAALVVQWNGTDRYLTWVRQAGGAIFWYLDGSKEPIVLGDSERAVQRLAKALGPIA